MVEWTDGTTTEGTLPTIFEVPADENEAITIRKNDG